MKHFNFENNWDQIKGQLKQRYGQLTDDDLTFAKGKGEELLGRLRGKLGMSEHDMNSMLEQMTATAGGSFEQAKAKVGEMADEVRARAGAAADEYKAKATAAVGQLKEGAGAVYEDARHRAQTLRGDGEDYVRQNPRQALVAALFAGFVAGLLIRH